MLQCFAVVRLRVTRAGTQVWREGSEAVCVVLQVLGNRGPLSQRDPGQVFATAARNCKTPEHGDDIEAVTASITA